ncbi:hypothetical protein CDD83_1598 [Cordyceps sp. RAO-2017]|nr:hypothetical protein CDD83_1598 [Cordyceps sp. RAO-2017]
MEPSSASGEALPSNTEKNGPVFVKSSSYSSDDFKHADPDGPGLSLSRARSIALVATVAGGSFLNTASIQSVVIILPSIGRELSVPNSRQQWIVSSYSLAFSCFLLFWGRVADIYGKRLIFILGSVWVTLMMATTPFMPNEIAFNLFRALHGLGAAANVPTAIGILGVTFPRGKAQNYAFSTYAAGAPLGNVFGNLISGLIAQYANWRWVFGVSAIMAGLVVVAGIVFIPHATINAASRVEMSAHGTNSSPLSRLSIDWIGVVLITSGLIALMFALTEGSVVGWRTPWVPVTIIASLLVIAIFVLWQSRLERLHGSQCGHTPSLLRPPPLIKVSIFRNLRFSAAIVIIGFFFASFGSFLVYATYYFQDFQGLSPLQTMLRFIPTGLVGALITVIVAQLLDRVPTFYILVCGNIAVPIASLLFAVPISPTTSYFAYGLPAMVLCVVGADTIWPCLGLLISQALPPEDQAMGGALITAIGQFGRAIGLAISTSVQTAVVAGARGMPVDTEEVGPIRPWEPESLRGLRAASWTNFGFGVISLAIVLVAFRSRDIVGKTTCSSLAQGRPDPEEDGERRV